MGLSTCTEASSPGGASLNAVPALNAMYELLQIHRRTMCTLEELEKEHLKDLSTLKHMQTTNSRLKARKLIFVQILRQKNSLHFLLDSAVFT